jgi:hypothetical protein
MIAKKRTEADEYCDLEGNRISLRDLTPDERKLLRDLERYAGRHSDWNEFGNYWLPKVAELYSKSRFTRRQIIRQPLFQIAQDIEGRLGIASGQARAPDYRDELESLIEARFPSRREFCEATGLTEDMVSHVLAKRKHLAINTLADALQRIGYRLQIARTT